MPNQKSITIEPPACLSKVPKSVVRALDVFGVLQDALSSIKHPNIYGPVIALDMIDSYYDAAKLQQKRIEKAKASIHRSIARAMRVKKRSNLFSDVHFYIISWARIYKLAKSIRNKTRFCRTSKVLRLYNKILKNRIDARDHLEHLEERLPGGEHLKKLDNPNDLSNMFNQYYTYGGFRIDVGPESIKLLRKFRDELFLAVLYDSIEILDSNDPDRLIFLLKRASKEVLDAQTTRQVNRMLKSRM
ncbi:MAG: hypothetical protein V1794_06960 [Candidatus Glassbacteria bacterium]